ncbi:MAG TPA: hypothetical protein VID72_11985 [Ktedonobacterales bacterium]
MRWLNRHRRVVAQDNGFWQETPPLDAYALRRSLIHQGRALQLRSPFSWQDYLGALLHFDVPPDAPHRANGDVGDAGERPLRVVYMMFGPGESARWVMQRQPGYAQMAERDARDSHPNALLADGVRYTLLLSELADDEYLEHIVYHELGHLERGHLAQALAMGSGELACASTREPGAVTSEMAIAQRWEQEAELFALTLTRLARGWDPALAPPSMSRFFDFLM